MQSEEVLRQLSAARGDIDALLRIFRENPDLDVNYVFESDKTTALHKAANYGHPKAVEYLISRGANPRLTDYIGHNAAHTACYSLVNDSGGALSVLQILLDKDRALLNMRTSMSYLHGQNYGETCLHLAICGSRTEILAWLLDMGADTTVETEHGNTAWDHALEFLGSALSQSDPAKINQAIDSFCAFLQREARLRNYPQSFGQVRTRKIRNLELYRPPRLSRIGIFALLEQLSQRNVLEQSCQQIRRELCQMVQTNNGRMYRETSCIFETHDRNYRGDQDTKPDGVGEDRMYFDFKEISSSDPTPLDITCSTSVSVDDVTALHSAPDQVILDGTKTKNSEPNYLSLVMPVMLTVSKKELDTTRSKRQTESNNLFKNFLYCRSTKENHIEFQGALTLDEYTYPSLFETILDRRNKDQTLLRLNERDWRPYALQGAQLVIVDQVGIWQAQDVLIFTRLEQEDGLRKILQELPTVPHVDALLTSYGQVGIFLADILDDTDFDSILDRFQISIVKLTEEVGDYSRQTGVESIGIAEEKRFFHEINDIREELSMIRRVMSQQEEIWRDFTSNAWPEICADSAGGRISHQSTNTPTDAEKQDQKEILKLIERPRIRIQKRQRRIAQLDEDAERVERSIGIQLDLKRQHTSLQEAHATAIISAAAFGFAVITIVFTPLSFVMSLFALPIDRFQESQIPSRWTSDAGMYSTKYIGTWAATTEIVSVALTLAATWLALEYGLGHRITRRIWRFLKFQKQALKDRLLLLRRKQKSEKDEENMTEMSFEAWMTMMGMLSVEGRASIESRASRASRVSRASEASRASGVGRASAAKRTSFEDGKEKENVRVNTSGVEQ